MKLIENSRLYWEFIRELRYHPDNISGFVNTDLITKEDQVSYMQNHGDSYSICIENDKPIGFIGEVNGDIRLAVSPTRKNQGIGKFMLDEFMKTHPFATAKIKLDNISSLRTFYSCGFVSNKVDGEFHYLSRGEHGNYKIKHNPYKIVTMFEECIADYTGAPYALSINSCTNALFLACKYFEVEDVYIPPKTYLSVPQ